MVDVKASPPETRRPRRNRKKHHREGRGGRKGKEKLYREGNNSKVKNRRVILPPSSFEKSTAG
jgi:hypothetical protein